VTNEDIAKRLGWVIEERVYATGGPICTWARPPHMSQASPLPNFLTDIGAAWMLVEWMHNEGWDCLISGLVSGDDAGKTVVNFSRNDPFGTGVDWANTAPEAIAKAFMAATEPGQ